MLSLKQLEGRLEDNFKTGAFDFSYSLLKKNAADLGIVVDGKHYVAYAVGDDLPVQQDVVMLKQNNVNQQQNIVKQGFKDTVEVQQNLTNDEIAFVKELYAKSQRNNEQQFFVNDKTMLVVPAMVGDKKTTGISVYTEQWDRWSAFKKKYQMYLGTDLLALALEEFMEKYEGGSDS